jgi:hypothetical protein
MLASSVAAHPILQTSDRETIRKARDSYYSLKRLGFSGFQSSIQQNWEVMLAEDIKKDPAAAQAGLKLLNGLHFAMTMDQDGQVSVTHRADLAPTNNQVAAGFDQIYSGMEQALSGFFATWNRFMLTSPLPALDSDYQLQDAGGQFLLTYKDGAASVSTTMTKDLRITEIKAVSSDSTSSIRPRFINTKKGFLLSGYAGVYVPSNGPGKVDLDTEVEYQEVNGLQIPRKLRIASSLDGAPSLMELSFLQSEVKVR